MKVFKQIGIAIGVAAAAVMTFAPLATAGVVLSNHDMIYKNTYSGSAAKGGACSFCHIPHKAGGARLWASVPTVGTGWRAESVSQLCYTCHSLSTYAGAQELNPFEDASHGRTLATLTGYGDATSTELGTAGVVLAADGNIKCTSCHDVHNNDARPFIKFVPVGTFAFNTMCETCHRHRGNAIGQETLNVVPNAGSAANFSQHPTDQVLGNTGDTQEGFVAFATEFAVVPGAANAPGVVGIAGWNLGGHRNDGTATGNFGCATCHAVHGNETANFSSAADGTTPVSPAVPPPYNAVTVRDPNPGVTNAAMCTGCHTSTMPIGPGTGGVSHPIGTSSNNWTIGLGTTPAALTTAMGAKWGNNGGNYVIVCQSCHDMHYAAPATSLLRGTIDSPTASSNSNCNACHASSTQANHHPSGVVYSGWPSPVTQTSAMTWSSLTKGGAGLAYSFGAGNTITCGTCHGGASDAHNNAGTTFPALAGYNGSSEMCYDCHSANPSAYTVNTHLGTLESSTVTADTSHFVGTIATTSYKFTGTWASGYLSKWGDTGAAIICESCHTLKFKAGAPATSDNGAGVAGSVKASVGLLLEKSGNNNNTFHGTAPAGAGPDLCTNCHGGQPSGGTGGAGVATHPAISTGYAGPVPSAITTRMAVAANGGMATMNSATLPNCESCHRPHDAAGGSGALILEGVGTDSTKVFNNRATANLGANYANEAPFCNMCHNY